MVCQGTPSASCSSANGLTMSEITSVLFRVSNEETGSLEMFASNLLAHKSKSLLRKRSEDHGCKSEMGQDKNIENFRRVVRI